MTELGTIASRRRDDGRRRRTAPITELGSVVINCGINQDFIATCRSSNGNSLYAGSTDIQMYMAKEREACFSIW